MVLLFKCPISQTVHLLKPAPTSWSLLPSLMKTLKPAQTGLYHAHTHLPTADSLSFLKLAVPLDLCIALATSSSGELLLIFHDPAHHPDCLL